MKGNLMKTDEAVDIDRKKLVEENQHRNDPILDMRKKASTLEGAP